MTRTWILLAVLFLSACAGRSDEQAGAGRLTVYGTTDRAQFAAVVDDFERSYPDTSVEYVELEAEPLYDRFLHEEAEGRVRADLLLSSATDLQVKLVNDGYAAAHLSQHASEMPDWSNWRNEAFGFTAEPVVMVFNTRLMAGRTIPSSRPELLADLRSDRKFWRGRIGTYDIVESSVGYFLASQDARFSSDFGALIEAFRDARVEQRGTTAALLDELADGKIALGYNLLGSYAHSRAERLPWLKVVYPEDYTLSVSRTAMIPRSAPHPEAAHQFLEYLLSPRGQKILTQDSDLKAIRDETNSPGRQREIDSIRPIPLGPGLLVYLDRQKHARMLDLFGIQRSADHSDRGEGPLRTTEMPMTD